MRPYFLLLLLIAMSLTTFSQPQQKKSFYVNACKFYGTFSTELQPICSGFEIHINQSDINIGEETDLKIVSRELSEGKIKYILSDPKGEIIGAFQGKTSLGNDYLQLVFKSDKESGVIFQYWDQVSFYDFWRLRRNKKN